MPIAGVRISPVPAHRQYCRCRKDTCSSIGRRCCRARASGRAYVYAESILVPSRLSDRFRLRLDSTSDPIGRILDDEALVVTRSPLCGPDRPDVSVPAGTRPPTGDVLLSRSYRIDAGAVPVMVISEWFLSSLSSYFPDGRSGAQMGGSRPRT